MSLVEKHEPIKDDAAKPRMDLVCPYFMHGLGEVLTYGEAKYRARNWEPGMAWGRYFGALMRHMWAWWRGERFDPESNLPHLWHAAFCIMALVSYEERGVGDDDRPT